MILIIDRIRGPVDHISDLEIIGNYSINGEREYCSGIEQLKYYKKPLNSRNVNLNLDLNENTIRKIQDNAKLNDILTWILENFDIFKIQDSKDITQWILPQFVSFRGTLKYLLITPYERYNGWIICASKFKGTIYLCYFDTEEKKRKESSTKTNYQQKCIDWGFKFEQYMLADTPDNEPNTSQCVNQNEEFCCMFKSKFGENTLLYGAEVDGIRSEKIINDTIVGKKCELVELKTVDKDSISNNGPRNKFKNLLWWAQSYPAGIRKIVCGCKDKEGFVTEIKEAETSTFYVKEKERCKSFCSGFLEQVKTIVREDYDKCLYKFTCNPIERIITVDKMKPDNESEYMFLHSWYTDNIKTKCKNKK